MQFDAQNLNTSRTKPSLSRFAFIVSKEARNSCEEKTGMPWNEQCGAATRCSEGKMPAKYVANSAGEGAEDILWRFPRTGSCLSISSSDKFLKPSRRSMVRLFRLSRWRSNFRMRLDAAALSPRFGAPRLSANNFCNASSVHTWGIRVFAPSFFPSSRTLFLIMLSSSEML